MLWTLDNPLRPQTPPTNRENVIPKTIFFVGFRKVTAAAKRAGRENKIMQTLTIRKIGRVEP
jgi:hypothetical protein